MKKIILISSAIIIATNLAFTQGTAINNTGASADSSAMLDVSSTSKGILIPRMSKAEKLLILSPANGLLIYQTDDTTGFWYFNSVKWVQAIGTAGAAGATGATGGWTQCSSAPSAPGSISGAAGACQNSVSNYFVAEVSGATSYTWSYSGTGVSFSGLTNAVSIDFSITATSGDLTVTASNSCGSSSSSPPLAVTILPAPVSTFSSNPSSPYDMNEQITFNPTTTPSTYYWSFSGGTPAASVAQNPVVYWSPYVNPGSYNVSLTLSQGGCSSTTTNAISVDCHGSQTFSFTGSQQTWTVPSSGCISTITIEAWGGEGGVGGNGGAKGKGGYAKGDLNVSQGQVIYIYVGGAASGYSTPGWNGGGTCQQTGSGAGGGASDVRAGGVALSNRVIVAGGGGGTGVGVNGGDGGGTTGISGQNKVTTSCGTCTAYGGGGGSQASGGSAGTPSPSGGWGVPGLPGSSGNGGNAQQLSGHANGGGGGGGYFGGGSAASDYCNSYGAGGGGGSGYVGGVTNSSMSTGVRTGNGQIIISW